MKKIVMLPIQHKSQRYDTVGDYQDMHGVILFTISQMDDERHELLVAVHELVEKILCDARGITNQSIDEFDMAFEAKREEGNTDEPGHDPAAPYHAAHVFAERVERLLAAELGVDWDEYDRIVTEL